MIDTQEKNCEHVMQRTLSLLQSCLTVAQAKTRLLMRHDLTGLEAILVREAEIMERLNEAQWASAATEIESCEELLAESISLKSEICAVAKEIRITNQTNARFIEKGQRFCEVLYEAICPPQTYTPSLSVLSRETESTFQAQY
jgi:uncharacterized protein YoaH (UPF0181 family)